MRAVLIAAILALGLSHPALAEVQSASPSAILIQAETTTSASPAETWQALTRIGRWWNPAHTFSGDARRLRLDARAGGCFCETWGEGQSVEHGRVILVMNHEGTRTLRLAGGLGPLQDMGVSGILTFLVSEDAAGAKITMTYRVAGDGALNLDQLAPLVDGVLSEQLGRLARYSRGERLN